ncbi:MAG: hypothetical protein ACI8P9_005266 [Parasphingorhabdus sp.]|jgi:hypothetical protein
MIDAFLQNEHAGSFSRRQYVFFRYTFFVLIDLTVLNLFNQYWDLVFIENFSISLLTALLLQVLLQITIAIEHRVTNFFKQKSGIKARVLRGLSTWGIVFGSKLLILQAINISFGGSVLFSGPKHGLVAFIIVVIAMIVAEQIILWIYRSLG